MTRYNPNRLYKNTRNGKFMGVCAGIADYFDVQPNVIRFLTILGSIFGFFLPIIIAYFVLGAILERKPEELYNDPAEDEFWRKVRTAPDYTAVDLRRRFEDIERRTRNMEAYMTSKKFKLEKELKNLED